MAEHTKEPWKTGTRYPSRVLAERANVANCSLSEDEDAPSATQVADARRIVACVNACAGISTGALEAGAVAEALKALAVIMDPKADPWDRPGEIPETWAAARNALRLLGVEV